jgi:hypothetical protein
MPFIAVNSGLSECSITPLLMGKLRSSLSLIELIVKWLWQ